MTSAGKLRTLIVSMKKKAVRRATHKKVVKSALHKPSQDYLMVVRGWMVVVAFALMLGLGAIVGNFFNQKLNESNPAVAGASTAR